MKYDKKTIIILALIVIVLTLRVKRTDNTVTIQFGLWQLIKDYLKK